MPGPLIHALSIPQWGLESVKAPGTPGAAVPATKKIAVKDFLIRPTDSISRDESPLKGMVVANTGGEIVVARGTDWEVPETPFFFDEGHYWLAMAIVGGVTPTGAGPYVWTYTLNPVSYGAGRDIRTIELRMSDGTNPPSDWEIPAAFLEEIEYIGSVDQAVRFAAKGKGRRLQSSTLSVGPTMFGTTGAGTPQSSLRIDSTWAGRGTTQIVGQIIGWRFKIATGLMGQYTVDGRTDLDYGIAILNPEEVKWTIEVDFKALGVSAVWTAEKTAAEAGTLRAVEIRVDNTATYQLKLQALVKHSAASVFPAERQSGEITGKLVFEGSTDDTNALAVVLTNNTNAPVA